MTGLWLILFLVAAIRGIQGLLLLLSANEVQRRPILLT